MSASPSSAAGSSRTLRPSSFDEADVHVQAASTPVGEGPADERRAVSTPGGDLVGEHAEQERVVGRAHRLVVAEVDLELRVVELGAPRLDRKPQPFAVSTISPTTPSGSTAMPVPYTRDPGVSIDAHPPVLSGFRR